ncbi:MAG: polysaccharide deacetylase family protein [Candidatus Omnitrophica bacterium]|nr:polysaccharide deacetylase family protein [Candidatus Omnitrophota bacterium]
MSNQLPILNYHGIESHPEEYPWLEEERPYVVKKNDFKQQMETAVLKGFTTIDLDGLAAWLQTGFGPEQPFMITFDDGHISHLEYALISLKKRNFNAIFFVTPTLVGQPYFMTWDDLKFLIDEGFEIGAHGYHHRPMIGLKSDEIRMEFEKSKEVLEKELEVPIRAFSVPRGFYRPSFKAIARQAGYEFVFTSQFDVNKQKHDPFSLKRMVVRQDTDLKKFQKLLTGDLSAARPIEAAKEMARRVLKPAIYDRLADIKNRFGQKRTKN